MTIVSLSFSRLLVLSIEIALVEGACTGELSLRRLLLHYYYYYYYYYYYQCHYQHLHY